MPRRVFNKLVIHHRKGEVRWYLKPFQRLLHEPALWATHRKSVLRGLAIGLFIGLLPLPGHVVYGGLAAVYFRVNLPVAVIATLITNPLTVGPLLYFDYRIGTFLLGASPEALNIQWNMEWISSRLAEVFKPILLGSLVVAPAGALLGYAILNLVWRISTGLRFRRRRRGKPDPAGRPGSPECDPSDPQ